MTIAEKVGTFLNITATIQGNSSSRSWWRFNFFDNLKRLVSGSSNSCNLGRKHPSPLHPKTWKPMMNLFGFHYGQISTTHLLNTLLLSRAFIFYLIDKENWLVLFLSSEMWKILAFLFSFTTGCQIGLWEILVLVLLGSFCFYVLRLMVPESYQKPI